MSKIALRSMEEMLEKKIEATLKYKGMNIIKNIKEDEEQQVGLTIFMT